LLKPAFSIELNYEIDPPGADFILNNHAEQSRHSTAVNDLHEV